ncbi:kinase-like domain-containing protein [Mycena sanguinolenta]|nr:kinase-like domain-containing protein [Mycena sanguinolenta]
MQQAPIPRPHLRIPNKSPVPPTLSTATSDTFSKGQIHVKLVQARDLRVKSSPARPYVSVEFEQNEFISRDPTNATDTPTAVPTSRAMSVLSAIGSKAAAAEDSRRGTKASGESSNSLPTGPFDRISPYNPIWKHEVSFDVFSEASLITFNVYDGADSNHTFLGTVQIKPVLVHDNTIDQWYKLHPYENEVVSGELRVQMTFEEYRTRRAPSPRDFEFLKLIHRGTLGKVFQVRKRDTKRMYAMKVLSKKEIVAKKVLGERKILQRSFESPFLVGLKFTFQTDTNWYLITDFKSGGELVWHLQRETRFSVDRARFYIAEIILALEHLHKHDIVYRDLKPEKIMLDATGHVALCDFSLSKADFRSDELTSMSEYLAPEIILDELGYSKVADFWSLGVLLFEMCCGWSPFYAEDTEQMYQNICFGKIRFPKGSITDDGKQFVKGLLHRNPKDRLGALRDAEELKEHPFFSSIDWEALSRKQVMPPFKPVVESDEPTVNFDALTLVELGEEDHPAEGFVDIPIPKHSVREQVMPPYQPAFGSDKPAVSFDEYIRIPKHHLPSPPIDIQISKHRLDAVRDSGEFKEHPLNERKWFSRVGREAPVGKQITPPLKPVESDELTTDFDEVFKSVTPVVESDEPAVNEIGLVDLNDEEGLSSSQPEGYIDGLLASWERRRPLLSMTVPEANRRGLSSDQIRQRLRDGEAQISTLLIHILSSREARRAAQRLERDRAQ